MLDAARQGSPSVDTCLLTDDEGTEELILMPDDARPLDFQWGFLFDLLSSEHRTPADAEGQCFRNLVVGARRSRCTSGLTTDDDHDPGNVNVATTVAERRRLQHMLERAVSGSHRCSLQSKQSHSGSGIRHSNVMHGSDPACTV